MRLRYVRQSERTTARDAVQYKRLIYPYYRVIITEHEQRWACWLCTTPSKHMANVINKGTTSVKVHKFCAPVNKSMSEISKCFHYFSCNPWRTQWFQYARSRKQRVGWKFNFQSNVLCWLVVKLKQKILSWTRNWTRPYSFTCYCATITLSRPTSLSGCKHEIPYHYWSFKYMNACLYGRNNHRFCGPEVTKDWPKEINSTLDQQLSWMAQLVEY